MLAVLEAFAVIGAIIAVGAIVGRTGVLGANARMVLNRVAFHIGVPALMLLNLSESSLSHIFSHGLLISVLTSLGAFAACFVILTVLRRRSSGDSVIASWAASYVNAGNLGIPLSAYVFGGTTEISAIILFQVIVMAPIGIAILNSSTTPRASPARQILALISNPIIAASVVGLVMAALGIQLGGVVADPVRMLADLAIPTVLIAFGIALTGGSAEQAGTDRGDLLIVVVIKSLLMPASAFILARWGFNAPPEEVLLVTVLAALPGAQNINAYAAVYGRNESLARQATLITTAASAPVIVAIVVLLNS